MDIINAGWFGILAGALIGYYFYRVSKREPRGCYALRRVGVVGLRGSADINEHVAVSYKGAAVPRLSVATLTFWNGGNVVLDGNALVQRDPLRVEIQSDGAILEVSLLANPNPECNCVVSVDAANPTRAGITFDFLNPQNGFTFRVLHTGLAAGASVAGTLKGVSLQSEEGSAENVARAKKIQIASLLLVGSMFAAFVAAGFLGIVVQNEAIQKVVPAALVQLLAPKGPLSEFAAGFIVLSAVWMMANDLPLRVAANRIPKALGQ